MPRSQRHQSAGRDILNVAVYHWQLVFLRSGRQREASGIDKTVDCVRESLGTECQRAVKSRLDILGLANIQRLNFDAYTTSFGTE